MRYIDYGTMQNDARRRVLEMQRRADSAVFQQQPVTARIEDSVGSTRWNDANTHEDCCTEQPVQEVQEVQDAHSDCTPASDGCTARSGLAVRDPEQMLLLAILVLLLAEKADTVLILALVYLLI